MGEGTVYYNLEPVKIDKRRASGSVGLRLRYLSPRRSVGTQNRPGSIRLLSNGGMARVILK